MTDLRAAAAAFLTVALAHAPADDHATLHGIAQALSTADAADAEADPQRAAIWRRAAHAELARLGLTIEGENVAPQRKETPA